MRWNNTLSGAVLVITALRELWKTWLCGVEDLFISFSFALGLIHLWRQRVRTRNHPRGGWSCCSLSSPVLFSGFWACIHTGCGFQASGSGTQLLSQPCGIQPPEPLCHLLAGGCVLMKELASRWVVLIRQAQREGRGVADGRVSKRGRKQEGPWGSRRPVWPATRSGR